MLAEVRHCSICRKELGVLRLVILLHANGRGIVAQAFPLATGGSEETKARYLSYAENALAIVDRPACYKTFLRQWALAHDSAPN